MGPSLGRFLPEAGAGRRPTVESATPHGGRTGAVPQWHPVDPEDWQHRGADLAGPTIRRIKPATGWFQQWVRAGVLRSILEILARALSRPRLSGSAPDTADARRSPAASLPTPVEGRATLCLVPELSATRRALRAIGRELSRDVTPGHAASFCCGVYEMASSLR